MSGRILKIGGVPSEKQREFFRSRAKYTAYGGARGGGKSWALRRKLVGLCLSVYSLMLADFIFNMFYLYRTGSHFNLM